MCEDFYNHIENENGKWIKYATKKASGWDIKVMFPVVTKYLKQKKAIVVKLHIYRKPLIK